MWGIVGNLFRGIHSLSLDGKGRLAVPSRYRALLQTEHDGQIIVTIGIDNRCLWFYPLLRWQKLEQQLLSLPTLQKKTRRLQRLLIGHASECQMDGQGRILLTAPLRKYASLDKNIVMVGLGEKFEIWDEDSWDIRRNVWVEEEVLDETDEQPDLGSLRL